MAIIHFLNVLDGDCNIIQHDEGRVSLIDISNAYNDDDSELEKAAKHVKEKEVKKNNFVPDGKINYHRKEYPDNPIQYLKSLKVSSIWRFIISHPDMDHLDGIKDLYSEFSVYNTWDTDNVKELDLKTFPRKYNPEDWQFYKNLRSGKFGDSKRLTLFSASVGEMYTNDNLKILSPTPALVKSANAQGGDIHDLSYVILFTVPKANGGNWRIVFSGDSHDAAWDHIIKNHKQDVTNVDVLFAPHHGRDSDRSYDFLKVLNPKVTLLGNASSEHLAYSCYPEKRITNNQAGHVIIDVTKDRMLFLVEHKPFADNYRNNPKRNRNWGEAREYKGYGVTAYGLFQYSA